MAQPTAGLAQPLRYATRNAGPARCRRPEWPQRDSTADLSALRQLDVERALKVEPLPSGVLWRRVEGPDSDRSRKSGGNQ
jgi:hypothetical protein